MGRKRLNRSCAIFFPIRRSSAFPGLSESRWPGGSRGGGRRLRGKSIAISADARRSWSKPKHRRGLWKQRCRNIEAKAFVAMRCWHPFSDGAAAAVKSFAPDRIVLLLPLYPQFSTTTTASSLKDWDRAARHAGLAAPTARICCYPANKGFIAAAAAKIRAVTENLQEGVSYRLLLSAHGLPRRVIEKGDPYQWQVERTAKAIGHCGRIGDGKSRERLFAIKAGLGR